MFLEETPKYREAVREIQLGNKAWKARTLDELNHTLSEIDDLYESMRTHGYLSQSKLRTSEENHPFEPTDKYVIQGVKVPHEAIIGVGRNGELIRIDAARHRLSIAKMLGLKNITVVVSVRHEKWQRVRDSYQQADTFEDIPDEFKKYSSHPLLQDVSLSLDERK